MDYMNLNAFISKKTTPVDYLTSWEAPSNIALIKYWGKQDSQIPKNPSLSFTLSSSVSKTEVSFKPKKSGKFDFDFYFEKKLKPEFKPKLQIFFKRIESYIPWIKGHDLIIKSHNSFPHSSGIASSASAMASLSLCLMDLERHFFPSMNKSFFYQKASFLARLGSGSAARSVLGPVTLWGENRTLETCSNLYAINFGEDLNPVFKSYQDTILLVDRGTKVISSSKGHDLMHEHPFASNRFLQASNNLDSLLPIMKSGDIDAFIKIVELEALSLHAMMMTSTPYFILIKPNTLEIIQRIWDFRMSQKIPICFTLDAGANVHLLYPLEYKRHVLSFIDRDLKSFCENEQYLIDQVGQGARKL